MATTKLKLRCLKIETADVITSEADIATAAWVEQPLTLRDDELSIVEQDPTEEEVFSHENDAAEDYNVVGNGMVAVGSFIKASLAQMKELIGGAISGTGVDAMFLKSAKKVSINKAFKFHLYGGGYIIIPNAKGFVNLSANLGAEDGMLKFPFSLRALAQVGWDCDLIYKPDGIAGASLPLAAPLSAPVAEDKTEEKAAKSK